MHGNEPSWDSVRSTSEIVHIYVSPFEKHEFITLSFIFNFCGMSLALFVLGFGFDRVRFWSVGLCLECSGLVNITDFRHTVRVATYS